ncbi:MAG: hypothetical protein IKB71_07255 [Lentisphaeria bacterium]|nr:hypothetical protein [Lentisphaeria bacterium]
MRDVYLVASNVRPSDVSRTLGHEIIGHKGLRSVFGENFNTILDSVYNSHSEELIQYARTYNRDTETIENRRYLTEEFLSDCADLKVKPSCWKEFIASIRQMLRRIFPKMRISDADINGWLSKAHRTVQNKTGRSVGNFGSIGARFSVDGKYFKNWQDVIEQFKKDLEGIELNQEQQDIYDVVTQQKDKIRLRINDLNELEDIFINFGSRQKGVKKFISVHYAGLRNPVTALEVLNIGDVIRRGKITKEGNADYPTSRRYELQAEDGAMLKVIIDFNRKMIKINR